VEGAGGAVGLGGGAGGGGAGCFAGAGGEEGALCGPGMVAVRSAWAGDGGAGSGGRRAGAQGPLAGGGRCHVLPYTRVSKERGGMNKGRRGAKQRNQKPANRVLCEDESLHGIG